MKPIVFGIFMTVLVGAGLAWLWHSEQSATAPDTQAATKETSQPPQQEREVHPVIRELPATAALPSSQAETQPEPSDNIPEVVAAPAQLDQSDNQVDKAVKDLSATITQWITPKEQLRKWVLLVDNIASGKVPVKNRPVNFALTPFAVTGSEEAPVMAESNFSRTEPLVNAFMALDPELLAHYYSAWNPLLQDAFQELGQPGQFHDRLLAAIDRVLAVQPLEDEAIQLKQPAVYYRYANPQQEAASDVEKLLWRMGSRNMIRLQSQLREIRQALQNVQ